MKKTLITILLLASTVILPGVSSVSYAAPRQTNPLIPVCNEGNNIGTSTQGHKTDICINVNDQTAEVNPIVRIIKAATKVVGYLAGAMAVIFIILSAFRFITANGDSSSMAQARQALMYALVGIVIVVLAQIIVVFVLEKL